MTEQPISTHGTCPECGHHGCYTVWSDGGSFCHSCGGRTKSKTAEDTGVDLFFDPAIRRSECVSYRGIDKDVTELYHIKTGYNAEGKEVRREYSYPHRTKYRYLPKDFGHNLGFKANRLFGMNLFTAGSAKTITITEGEDDAAAAYQMLGKKVPVVSLPSASIQHDLINDCGDYLRSFDEIVLCTDGDEAGQRAAKRLATAFPNRVFLVQLGTATEKDACDYLAAGKQTEFFKVWNNRKKHVPSGFWNTSEQFVGILREDNDTLYYPTPIEELNESIKGLPLGHLVVLTGPEGQGKTEVMHMLEYNMVKNYPEVNVGILHMEETRKTLLRTLACYELDENVRYPDSMTPESTVEDAVTRLTNKGNLYLFDFHIDEDPLSILEKVRFLKEALDVQVVFIDPIQQLAYGTRRDQTEEQILSQISVQLERLATDLNMCIVMTTHVNDDGQTRSSRMIGKSASVRLDLTRDHMNTDPVIRNTTKISVSKNRPFSTTGYGGTIVFDQVTFTLKEA